MLYVLVAGLVIWMAGCAYAGYHRQFGLFLGVTLAGMALNALWMRAGLDARLLSPHALMAHAGTLIYACVALASGWFAGRVARGLRSRRPIQ
jgi:hypothetical protein